MRPAGVTVRTPTEENEVLLSSVASGSANKSRTGQPLQSEDQDDGRGWDRFLVTQRNIWKDSRAVDTAFL